MEWNDNDILGKWFLWIYMDACNTIGSLMATFRLEAMIS